MEHSLPQNELVRPWRTATLVATGIAALELALLVAIAVPALGSEVAGQVRAAATEEVLAPADPKPVAPAETPPVPQPLPRGETSVLVLNGNGVAGAASEAAARVRGLGYVVASYGNAPRSDYGRTLVMYRGGREAEARRLAKDLGAAVVAPLDGMRADELMGAHLAVVLGAS